MIAVNDLSVDQRDTGTANLDRLFPQIDSFRQLVAKLTSAMQRQTEAFQNQTSTKPKTDQNNRRTEWDPVLRGKIS
jgi:hypothetical protein